MEFGNHDSSLAAPLFRHLSTIWLWLESFSQVLLVCLYSEASQLGDFECWSNGTQNLKLIKWRSYVDGTYWTVWSADWSADWGADWGADWRAEGYDTLPPWGCAVRFFNNSIQHLCSVHCLYTQKIRYWHQVIKNCMNRLRVARYLSISSVHDHYNFNSIWGFERIEIKSKIKMEIVESIWRVLEGGWVWQSTVG